MFRDGPILILIANHWTGSFQFSSHNYIKPTLHSIMVKLTFILLLALVSAAAVEGERSAFK